MATAPGFPPAPREGMNVFPTEALAEIPEHLSGVYAILRSENGGTECVVIYVNSESDCIRQAVETRLKLDRISKHNPTHIAWRQVFAPQLRDIAPSFAACQQIALEIISEHPPLEGP